LPTTEENHGKISQGSRIFCTSDEQTYPVYPKNQSHHYHYFNTLDMKPISRKINISYNQAGQFDIERTVEALLAHAAQGYEIVRFDIGHNNNSM
jgi:hypothetical protein